MDSEYFRWTPIPDGNSYAQWTEKWWQWVLSIPEDKNPLNDQTGKNCSTAQSGNVWFLAGTAGGSVTCNRYYPVRQSVFCCHHLMRNARTLSSLLLNLKRS